MRGLYVENGALSFRADLPRPEPRAGHSRIRVHQAGVCATDLALVRGYMGFQGTPGHEFVGQAIDGPHEGARVVGEINAACGKCDWCTRDLGRHCPNRTVLGILNHPGCFAEEVILPNGNLLEVPAEVSTDAATFAEPVAAAFEIHEQLPLHPGMRTLVAGDGRLGLLCAQMLARFNTHVTVAGRHKDRASLLPAGVEIVEGLLEEDSPGPRPSTETFDLAVEATGRPEVLQRLIPWVRPRGHLVLKTTSEAPAPLDLSLAVVNEISLVGSRCGLFAPALEALRDQSVRVEEMIQARYPLEDGVLAFEKASEPGTLKVLVDIAGSSE